MVLYMKMHSFLASNEEYHFGNKTEAAPQTENQKESTDEPVVKYPENVTFSNFTMYLLYPTLVYEISYPRTKKYDHRW